MGVVYEAQREDLQRAVALFTSIISAERARAERVTDDAIVAFLRE